MFIHLKAYLQIQFQYSVFVLIYWDRNFQNKIKIEMLIENLKFTEYKKNAIDYYKIEKL